MDASAQEQGLKQLSVDSPLGTLLLAASRHGLCAVDFDGEQGHSDESPHLEQAASELEQYFSGSRREFETPLDLSSLSPFMARVLGALRAVPFGETVSYGELALASGSPLAARAVGQAMGRNSLPVLIGCHRVLAAGNRLGGYGGGLERKLYLLELEGVRPAL